MRIFEILLRNIIEKKQGPMFHVKHWPLLVLLTMISSSATMDSCSGAGIDRNLNNCLNSTLLEQVLDES